MSLITINKTNFLHNIEIFQKHINKVNKNMILSMVLKDNAYGHGLELMANLCLDCGIKDIFIKNFSELNRIKNIADKFNSICCLYGLPCEDLSENIYTTIHKLEDLDTLSTRPYKNKINIEIKVNIGMNRNGLSKEVLISGLKKALSKNMNIKGVFAHNGFGDNEGENFNLQMNNFKEIKEMTKDFCATNSIPLPRFHSLNSSGLLKVNSSNEDLARVGIGLYGYLHSDTMNLDSELRPILKLYGDKITTQRLKKGDSVGYGGITKIKDAINISTYDIGYGDGFYRVNGSKILKTPDGLEILPISSMDCVSVFSSENRICLMDNAKYIGNTFNTISYEVLTRLSPFIPREVIN